jgi:hypothetical protein
LEQGWNRVGTPRCFGSPAPRNPNFRKSGWVGHAEPGIHTHFQSGLTWLPYPAIMPPNYLKLVRGYKLDHLLFQT